MIFWLYGVSLYEICDGISKCISQLVKSSLAFCSLFYLMRVCLVYSIIVVAVTDSHGAMRHNEALVGISPNFYFSLSLVLALLSLQFSLFLLDDEAFKTSVIDHVSLTDKLEGCAVCLSRSLLNRYASANKRTSERHGRFRRTCWTCEKRFALCAVSI